MTKPKPANPALSISDTDLACALAQIGAEVDIGEFGGLRPVKVMPAAPDVTAVGNEVRGKVQADGYRGLRERTAGDHRPSRAIG